MGRAGGGARHGRRAGHYDTAAGSATRPGGTNTTRTDPPTTQPHPRDHARPGHACVRKLGVLAGPAGCALGALSLFLTQFDSVLFLSQPLDTVHEPGS